ncbi:LacI family transcriptional regulator [Actinomadura sp. KC06]|uniref:LacI family DNA-binding transcriptional regulator n=1 Tax=Actinomadura sp. KC06 TaxID=2530369 RepID=UPI00104A6924|nr:LacI family DNA-binding transcriptional regulator [Actinomadura sp. KC06]TDD34241.1 LacI family transcriptional regulator [Actinomadura sp. KC06]
MGSREAADGNGGDRPARPRIKDVAAHCGVAPSSVSRVLTGHPSVGAELRERVLRSVRALGYSPDLLAQALRSQRTRTVGFVVGDISNPLIADIVAGAEERLRKSRYSVLLTNSMREPDREAEHIRLLQRRRVDGLLLSLSSESHAGTLAAIEEESGPVVLIDRTLPGEPTASAVLSAHATGMRAAVGHLLRLGHTRIGLMVGPGVRPAKERVRSLLEVYREQGAPPDYLIRQDVPLTVPAAKEAALSMFRDAGGCTALIVGGNQLLPGVMTALHELDLRPGADIAFIACDRTVVTDVLKPEIAVIHRDNRQVGYEAADLLLRQFDSDGRVETVTLPTEFLPGRTCCPLSADLYRRH